MKILFATSNFYLPQQTGGAELSTHDLCHLLAKEGMKCAVLADLKPGDITYFNNRIKYKLTGVRFPRDTSLGYPVYRGWNPILGVEEVANKFNPDIAIIQGGQYVLLANEFLKRDIKTIIYIRDVAFKIHGGKYIDHPLLNYIANSKYTADTFKKEFNLKAKIIPPIVHTENYVVESKREKVVFICPIPNKGVELAIQLAEANKDIPFLFVESWHTAPEVLKTYKEQSARCSNINWLKKQHDMKSIYSQAKFMLIPSIVKETWGRVATESQISGIPAIASNRGGLHESVGEGGITIEPENNFDEWNYYLRKLWFDSDFYNSLSQSAYKYSQRQDISPDFLLSEFISFIKSI